MMKRMMCLAAGAFVLAAVAAEPKAAGIAAFENGNGDFGIAFRPDDGTLESLTLKGDPERMNWIEGSGRWGEVRLRTATDGEPRVMRFAGVRTEGAATVSAYAEGGLRAEVRRTVSAQGLLEEWTVTNGTAEKQAFPRGRIGFTLPFNDSSTLSGICLKQRCHTHLWCEGECFYMHARKVGPFPKEIGLFGLAGEMAGYSVRRTVKGASDDRGDFVMLPAAFELAPGGTRRFAWIVRVFEAGGFARAQFLQEGARRLRFAHETVFPGERFEVTVEAPGGVKRACARVNGAATACEVKDGVARVSFEPTAFGEYRFEVTADGRTAKGCGWKSPHPDDLATARAKFLVGRQQCRDADSPLRGAYLVYDNETGRQVHDDTWRDWNAGRERLGMGLFMCAYLKRHPGDAAARKSLADYEAFLRRELTDEQGNVYDGYRRNPRYMTRFYNWGWVIAFWYEMHELTGEATHLDMLERTLRSYYARGAKHWYPLVAMLSSSVAKLKRAGRDVRDLEAALAETIDFVCRTGTAFPPGEVKYESTCVAPALRMVAQHAVEFGRTPALDAAAPELAEALRRFCGDQPHHRLGEIPNRYWDGYWFGKRRAYGDNFPHYWSALNGGAYVYYAKMTGDATFLAAAERNLRNCLCIFSPDGRASCAYLYPFEVTMVPPEGEAGAKTRRGEFDDPFANDQDFALYVALKSGLFDRKAE